MKIVLIGMMGSGKSSVGRTLAHELGWKFYDIDSCIEDQEKRKIHEIFEIEGEPHFRILEKKMIQKLLGLDRVVIATGGGAPCDDENWRALSSSGTIVWLKATPQNLLERVRRKPLSQRPLLSKGNSPLEEIEKLLNSRENVYQKADLIIETDGLTLREVSKKIMEWFKKSYE